MVNYDPVQSLLCSYVLIQIETLENSKLKSYLLFGVDIKLVSYYEGWVHENTVLRRIFGHKSKLHYEYSTLHLMF